MMNPLAGYTILVTDDEPNLREILREELELEGASVIEAPNGVLAYQQLENCKVDAVLSDVRMPGGSGVDLLKRMKASGKSHPPVLLITGFADVAEDEALELGAFGLFGKPFDSHEIIEALDRALKLGAGKS